MTTLLRAVWTGGGFGLFVISVGMWLSLPRFIALNLPAVPGMVAWVALLGAMLGGILGLALSPLLALRLGPLWHIAAVGAAWVALELWAGLEGTAFRIMATAIPSGGVVLVLVGRWIARRWAWAPATVAVLVAAGAIATPPVYQAVTREPTPPVPPLPAAMPGAPDVLLIVLDTVRAENVSAYGYHRPTTPNLDALAAEGALFLDATSPSTWSLPSHASLFTGLFPSGHGAHGEHRFLEPDVPTLAEALAANGYETRCFTANAWISDSLGLTRGFAWSDEAWRDGAVSRGFLFIFRLLDRLGLGIPDKGGAQVVSNFEDWIETRPEDAPPAFVFMNFIEAHFPYHQLPDEYLVRFTSIPKDELHAISVRLLAAQFGGDSPAAEEVAEAAMAMYDGGILYSDFLLGRVVAALRAAGTLDDTILVVLSDHGELVGEHGVFGHGFALYEPMIRVPFFIRYPNRLQAGSRVSTPVSTVGIYATVLELLGLDPPGTPQVASLLPAISGGPPGGPALSERFATESVSSTAVDALSRTDIRFRSYRVGSMKLIEASDGTSHLFDLVADPGETRDLATSEPAELARLKGELNRWRAAVAVPGIDAPLADVAAPPIDPAAQERLRQLGYVE
jgi:arylsulfatase A-like enzyme